MAKTRIGLDIGSTGVRAAELSMKSIPPALVRVAQAPLLEDAVLDFHTLEQFERDGRKMLRLLLVAAQKEAIQRMVEAVEMAKLRPVGLDLIPFAIVRSVGSIDGM